MTTLAAMQAASEQFFVRQKNAHPELVEKLSKIENLAERKLWHQLTIELESFINEAVFSTGDDLLDMHKNFLTHFERKINQLKLVQFMVKISQQCKDNEAALTFLKEVSGQVSKDKEAFIVCQMQIARLKLEANDVEGCKVLLEESKELLDGSTGLESVVNSSYYHVLTLLNKRLEQATELYRNALLYLAYTPLESLSQQAKVELVTDMGFAALLGDKIYNFGELLAHPIFGILQGTAHAWLGEVLTVFNSGNIKAYDELVVKYTTQMSANAALVANATALREKIIILGLIDLAFQQPADNRTLRFDAIAAHTKLSIDEVELLLMKALSVKLVKGVIDQVDQSVRFTWLQPRVLDKAQMQALACSLEAWTQKVHETVVLLENETPELLA